MEMVVIDIQKLNKALTLATSSTKNLVKSGLNGDKTKFPELLAKYKWPGTRDFNLALIIIALYVYCLKSSNKELKKIGMKARMTNKNSPFEALEGGDGVTVAKNLTKHFGDKKIQKLILNLKDVKPDPNDKFNISENINFYNDNTCEKVFDNGLFERAKKIKPWKINENEVVRCIHLLTDPVQKQHTDNLKEEKKKLAEEKKELAAQATKEVNLMAKKANKEIKKSNKKSEKIAKLKGKLKTSKENSNKLKKELNTSKSTIEKQKNELENLEKARNDSENKIKEHENVIFELKEKLKSKNNELKNINELRNSDVAELNSRLQQAMKAFEDLASKEVKANATASRANQVFKNVLNDINNLPAAKSKSFGTVIKKIKEKSERILKNAELSSSLEKIRNSYDLSEMGSATLKKIINLYTDYTSIPTPQEDPKTNIEKYLEELKTFAGNIKNYAKNNETNPENLKSFKESTDKIANAISNIKFYITAEKSAKFGNYNYRDILCLEKDKEILKDAPQNTVEHTSNPIFKPYYYKTNNKDDALDYLKKHGGVLID